MQPVLYQCTNTNFFVCAEVVLEEQPAAAEPQPVTAAPSSYTWRIELEATSRYWNGWFEGLSAMFLRCTVPKLLLLAGIDRLDKDLTIGQMQGTVQIRFIRYLYRYQILVQIAYRITDIHFIQISLITRTEIYTLANSFALLILAVVVLKSL